MTIPDWTEAPSEATHWDEIADVWCNINGWWHNGIFQTLRKKTDWETDRYTPRPVDATVPDWKEAPDDATHFDAIAGIWCKEGNFWHGGGWIITENLEDLGNSRYTPSPVEAWFPIVGESCQVIELPGTYINCEILANRHGDYIYYVSEKHGFGMLAAEAFRPIRTQAQTDRTQLVKALNQLRNETDLGVVADVILSIGFRLER